MPIPTISSVTTATGGTAKGHTGGGTLLKIVGTNFQQQTTQPPGPNGIVPPPPASVRVFLGGVEARRVQVASASALWVTTEKRDAGVVSLEVRNVGPFGETIGTETATLLDAFEYARPIFTERSDLERVTKLLRDELARQVYPEVVVTAHTDWTDDPTSILRGIREAKVPTLFLAGPTLRPNSFQTHSVKPLIEVESGIFQEHRSQLADDLVFTVGAISQKYALLLGIVAEFRAFKTRTPFIYMPETEGSSTLYRFELKWEGDIVVESTPDDSNNRTCSGTIVVVGFEILTTAGLESDQVLSATAPVTEDVAITTAGILPGG
jgi:hypothetical protein